MTAAGSVPATLLIVDDNQALCQLLAWEFEDKGYAVWVAPDCHQAIASAGAMAFDFALVDFHLPTATAILCRAGSNSYCPRRRL